MINRLFNKTVTCLVRLNAQDSPDRKEHWYKYIFDNCSWVQTHMRAVNNTVISYGNDITVRIPLTSIEAKGYEYLPYNKWAKVEDKSNVFTFTVNGYAVLGEVTETIDSSTVSKVVASYRPDVLFTKSSKISLDFFAPHIKLRGQ